MKFIGRPPVKTTGNLLIDGQLYRFIYYSDLTYNETQVLNPRTNKYLKRRQNAVKSHESVRFVKRTVRRAIWESECPMCLKPFTILVPVNWPFHCQTPVRYCPSHRNLTTGESARVLFEKTITQMLNQSLLVSLDQMAEALGVKRDNTALADTLAKLKKAHLVFWHGCSYTKVPYKMHVARKIMCHEIGLRGQMTMPEIHAWFADPLTLKEAKLAVWFDPESAIKLPSVRVFVNKIRSGGYIVRDKHTYRLPYDYAIREAQDDAKRDLSARKPRT